MASLDIELLEQCVPGLRLAFDAEALVAAGSDHTENLNFPPEVVVWPRSTSEVSDVLAWAFERGIHVTAAGALTGLSGGALPVRGGIAMNFSKMDRIIEIDTANHQVIVEPGVIVQNLQDAVAARGLFYAVDPASRGTCTIGGNIAHNSGGPRAVKYGVTKDWVLNLEAVLADGSIITTGANTLKNSTGYNLTQLLVGSEGTLAIVTRATLKLLPLPAHTALMLAPFESAAEACSAVAAIFKAGTSPSALEFMERDAVELARKFTGLAAQADGHAQAGEPPYEAVLLIEVDAATPDGLMPQLEAIAEVLAHEGAGELQIADDAAGQDRLWKLRRSVGEAVKAHCIYKEEDTVVPRGRLPDLLARVKAIGKQYGFKSICYGHAGDGNLHINILKGAPPEELSDEFWNETLPVAIAELFKFVVEIGGTISGEHGIGWVQKPYLPIAIGAREREIMAGIRQVFDPRGILNPDKILP